MGAVAPPPHLNWIPEDDVLLKSALEAGASLESLAKGAVHFSRRFTIQELQDRWYSLLYDPVISEQASAEMVGLENSASIFQPRLNRSESLKEIACGQGKRKSQCIRKCYYAMRKRICNEPVDMADIDLLSGPGKCDFGDSHILTSPDCMIGSNHLGTQAPDYDISRCSFSEFGSFAAESTGDGVTPPFTSGQNLCQDPHFAGKNLTNNLSGPYGENIMLPSEPVEVSEFGQSKELPLCNLFEAEGLDNEENGYSEIGGLPFHSLGNSSLPQMPIWTDSGDANETEAVRFGGPGSNSSLDSDSMRRLNPSTEDYLAELSNTLFDFTNEDELLLSDTEGKDIIDKFYFDGLSSLLLDSPNVSELPIDGQGEVERVTGGNLIVLSDTKGIENCDPNRVPEARVPSSLSILKCSGPEYRNGVICCTLNTEDPDIPSNDDVFLPFRFPSPSSSSGFHRRLHETNYLVPSSVKDFSSYKANEGPIRMKTNHEDNSVLSHVLGSSKPVNTGSNYPIGEHGVKFELPKSSIQHVAVRSARNSECPTRISSENVTSNNFIVKIEKGGSAGMDWEKNLDHTSAGPCLDKHGHGVDISHKSANASRKELDAKAEILNNGSPNANSRQNLVVTEPIDNPLLSDQEELWLEDDFDVPYFSDVEAMILDMDLSPDEFDLSTNPGVQQYQHEQSKRTIIRLEQGADACTQRAIAAEGAFAVLYSHHSKHYIKKPEVLIGRATDDVHVDIDLGREKNGGKISRRQAIITLDIDGSFHLKNLGKCPIYVNGTEVAPGQSLSLTSGCLIEVRGLAFVFETNRAHVKQYVDTIEGSSFLEHKPLSRN